MRTIYTPDLGCAGLTSEKTGRNNPCTCGSGKKSKRCCGNETRYKNRQLETVDELTRKLKKAEKLRDETINNKHSKSKDKEMKYNEIIKDLTAKIDYLQKKKEQ